MTSDTLASPMNDTHGMDQGASLTGTGSCPNGSSPSVSPLTGFDPLREAATPKHTPGPWRYTGEWGEIKGANDYHTICKVGYSGSLGSHAAYEANARLIAAAPETLEALKALLGRCRIMGCGEGIEALEAARVIAKAEGR